MIEDCRLGGRWSLVLLSCASLGGCFDPPSADEASGMGSTSSLPPATTAPMTTGESASSGAAEGNPGMTSQPGGTTEGPDPDPDASAGATGFIFDVGGAETFGETEGPPLPGGPGSCRQSEAYGAAGGFPQFDDPAYAAFDSTVLVMTNNGYQPSGYALRVFDVSGSPPPPNMNYAAPMYIHPSWTQQNFGGPIFGLTLDSAGNIYVAPTRVFYGTSATPGTIYRVDAVTAAISVLGTVPNSGPALGNINYDCVSETIYIANHEDGRIWQMELDGTIRSTYRHSTGDVTIGAANDPGEPDGQFTPLGDRVWAVQSHAGRLYYSVWNEDSGRQSQMVENEIWSVGYVDEDGIPDASTAELEATIPGLNGATYSNPVSDISFASTGWMLAAERTMLNDTQTSAHQSTTYELQQMGGGGDWQVIGTTYVVGELPNSSAGGVDHDFEEGGYVWMTGDALDFYTPDVVYGVQGTPYGGGTITTSTLIDHDNELTQQDKTALGDCELPIPGDAMPPPPPPEG
jgi:hypothetical protein